MITAFFVLSVHAALHRSRRNFSSSFVGWSPPKSMTSTASKPGGGWTTRGAASSTAHRFSQRQHHAILGTKLLRLPLSEAHEIRDQVRLVHGTVAGAAARTAISRSCGTGSSTRKCGSKGSQSSCRLNVTESS